MWRRVPETAATGQRTAATCPFNPDGTVHTLKWIGVTRDGDRLFIPDSTFSDAVVGLSLSVSTPIPSLSLEPFMAYSRSLNRRFFSDRLYGGVGVVLGDFTIR